MLCERRARAALHAPRPRCPAGVASHPLGAHAVHRVIDRALSDRPDLEEQEAADARAVVACAVDRAHGFDAPVPHLHGAHGEALEEGDRNSLHQAHARRVPRTHPVVNQLAHPLLRASHPRRRRP